MTMILRSAAVLSLVAASLLGACSSKGSAARGDSSTASNPAAGSLEGPTRGADSAKGMGGMQGMQSMPGMMMGGMMDSMQAHMRTMDSMSADRMKAMLPEHRQLVATMLAQLNGEMRKMNMPADAKWTALTDSVRQDLVRLPDMSGTELRSFMPEHGGRVMRLMQMHRTMMGGMKM